jgi:tetratricopeptide (TPR) repeat protein
MPDTPTLRLTQSIELANVFNVEVELLGLGPRITAQSHFTFDLSEQERQDMRWYVEEYAQYPFAPYPERAKRIEQLMHDVGIRLFRSIFQQEGHQRLWAKVYENLSMVRIEIISTPQEAATLPWELLRDPYTDTAIALSAGAFVRALPRAVRQARVMQTTTLIRVLLVICRPAGQDDVPFRSVANRLIKGLSDKARAVVQLDVLRPPTFEHLSNVLRTAHNHGVPYHVVHFDGHGVYGDPTLLQQTMTVSPIAFRVSGPQGFLLFEHDDPTKQLVHGLDLGNLLYETKVPLLVLNACRSAHTEQSQDNENMQEEHNQDSENPYNKVRAFGSLAQQVMLQGATGVVAMRYNVYVVTAAQFMADLYTALTQGFTLGEAVTFSRKQLASNPLRHIIGTVELQDWMVPVVYEAEAVQLFASPVANTELKISITAVNATPKRGMLDEKLPPVPDVGFFGRDETLLALDRSFDKHHVVLLHALAGSGKTAAAAEFARWYALTGGVDGAVLFSTFEQHLSLIQLFDQLGLLFNPILQKDRIDWQAITDEAQKRAIVLQILAQVPVLWVWDNVETVAGFPANTLSAWSPAEQRDLVSFLREVRDTKAKFLLTSRGAEYDWLSNLPMRVNLLPMPLHERWQLAEALAAKYSVTLDRAAWRPLIVYSEGNPLTLMVAVGQALRGGLHSEQQLTGYVQQLRAGESVFDDDVREGRSRSLGASLSYGFAMAFTEQEQAILALLHYFQGFVATDVLQAMGNTRIPGHLHNLANLTHLQIVALLDRAAELGLLSRLGMDAYRIHPALPWFFHHLFTAHYPPSFGHHSKITCNSSDSNASDALFANPTRAYVEVMGELGNDNFWEYEGGNRGVIAMLNAEEANLLYALRLAQQHAWYDPITSILQGLRVLYEHLGRRAEWRQLVAEVMSDFVDPVTDGPLPEREEEWQLVTEYRVSLLQEDRQWVEAARLHGLVVNYARRKAEPLLTLPLEQLDRDQRNTIRYLAAAIHELGQIQAGQGLSDCVENYKKSYDIALWVGEDVGGAICAFNIGKTYIGDEIPALRDLEQAEYWSQRSLELLPEQDYLGRGRILGLLGSIAYARFKDVQQAGQSEAVLHEHLNVALKFYQQQLELTPTDAISEDDLAGVNSQLGNIYRETGHTDQAIAHYRESIRYKEQAGDFYSAADTRYNIAITYAQVGQLDDALLFMQAALHNYKQLGMVTAEVVRAQQLVVEYEQAAQGKHKD